MKYLLYFTAYFTLVTGYISISPLYSYEEFVQWEDPTFGGLKPLPAYSTGQKKIMELLKRENERLHKEIQEKLNFLSQNKEIIDGKFIRSFQAREQYNYPLKERFLVNHKVIIEVKGGGNDYKIDSIEFYSRRSRTNKNYTHPHTQIMRMRFDLSTDLEKLKISIKKLEPFGDNKDEVTIEEVYDPGLRVNIAKAYKNRLTELINNLDLQMANLGYHRERRIQFIKREMDTSSGGQQH